RSVPTGTQLPSVTQHPDFYFGLTAAADVPAKELLYPHLKPVEEDVRRMYILSHGAYHPGERRHHYGHAFQPPEHQVIRDNHDNNGLRVKDIMYWSEEKAKELGTKVTSQRLANWRARNQPEIGKVHDPLKDTLAHLPASHIFGITFPQDDYSAAELIGLTAPRRSSPVAESELAGTSDAKITGKVSAAAAPDLRPSPDPPLGVPTVRARRPGYVKRLADNTNYNDVLDAKALLHPTPQNTYGPAVLSEYARLRGLPDPKDLSSTAGMSAATQAAHAASSTYRRLRHPRPDVAPEDPGLALRSHLVALQPRTTLQRAVIGLSGPVAVAARRRVGIVLDLDLPKDHNRVASGGSGLAGVRDAAEGVGTGAVAAPAV
ncbi:hypothetical protein HK405_007478, partial [Cladochytrium tenue]